jgi:FHS family glucose/mannose:H+ symporter-like MFS transporter
MPASTPAKASTSAASLTLAAYVSFVPIGIATVLLGPMLPVLSARWLLNYSQSGALFSVQYIASTLAVGLSGVLASRWGFRFAIKTGLLLMAAGLALLLAGPKSLGIACIAAYGGGLGLAVPAANLLVAAANPERRSATLNLLNFFWSAGAVSCPILVATAAKHHALPLFLACVSSFSVIVAIGIAAMPGSIDEPSTSRNASQRVVPLIKSRPVLFLIMGALFLVYVGTENGFGGWVASYAKSLGTLTASLSLMTPSFFYTALMLGRWLAPLLLRSVDEVNLARAGLLLASAGTAGLLLSHGLTGVMASACAAGLGLSCVYPITISLLSLEYGSASSLIGSFMFVLSNIGGALFPWIVGVSANRFGTLKAGLFIPLLGCVVMYVLYQRSWTRVPIEPAA